MKLGKILVVFCLAATMLVGCGGKPKDISQDMYDLGLKALEVTEDYLAADLDTAEAYDKMSRIVKRCEEDEAFSRDESVIINIRLIETTLKKIEKIPESEEGEISDLKDTKESLSKLLGK